MCTAKEKSLLKRTIFVMSQYYTQLNRLGYVHSLSMEAWHRSMPINSTIYFVANQFSYCPVSLPKIVAYFFLRIYLPLVAG